MHFLRSKSLSRSAIHLGCMQGWEPDLDCQAYRSHCLHRASRPGDAVMVIAASIVLEEIAPPHQTVGSTR